MLALAACSGLGRDPVAVVWIGGDVHLGTAPTAKTAAERLAPLAAITAGAAGIVNLEGPVGPPPPPAPPLRLANAAQLVAGLRAAGVRVIGIANNHAGDGGDAGRAATLEALAAADLVPAGEVPALLVVDGVRIVVTAHELRAELGAVDSHGAPIDLAAALAAARRQGDVLIATFHVTGPPSYLPRPELRAAVDVALAAGAAVVAAHGSHALAAVERRGAAVIAWGLGNLLFACACTDEHDAAILRLELDRHGVRNADIVPVDAGLDGALARPASDPAATFDLLEVLRSSRLQRAGDRARF